MSELAALQEKLAKLEQIARAAWDYVYLNVPDFDEIERREAALREAVEDLGYRSDA